MVRQSRPSKLSQGRLAGVKTGVGLIEKVEHCRQVGAGILFISEMGEGMNGYGRMGCVFL
jgi:hypothetical protein